MYSSHTLRGALRVTISLKSRVLRLEGISMFEFVLDPVSVKQFDVLESKLRDQQDELERIRGDMLAHAELKASTRNFEGNILWNDTKSETVAVNSDTGEVSIPCPGIYMIDTVVKAQPSRLNESASLRKNGEIIESASFDYDRKNPTICSSVLLSLTMWFEANDFVAVDCSCDIEQAFLSIVRL
ncbi:hypothetical protein PsorP6_015849 [Peronosclerospora sorghi]|uniref:Uncharacterized protein n=1 Tax=Peronosclerospora sorghi TaxID=230839 RepID=A0ACC0WR29_9STRA|nr:hypothetical protein PsorP6_015849 [Peronosclerospora sorghi]